MSAHTPGPWAIYPETDGREICAVDMVDRLPIRQRICSPVIGENWLANARLIAAAPDLLAALKLAESVYRKNCVAKGEPSSVLNTMQAALAMAEGR